MKEIYYKNKSFELVFDIKLAVINIKNTEILTNFEF